MIKHLRQIAQHFFEKKISDEMQVLQHQIALLQDSLAMLTTYHEEMVSTGVIVPEFARFSSAVDRFLIVLSTDFYVYRIHFFCNDRVPALFSNIYTHVLVMTEFWSFF